MMFCVAASRMRVLASATPLAGEKWKVATPALGLPSASTSTSVTCDCSLIGLSTVTVIGTVLPFSAISGRSSFTLPSVACLPPVNALIRSCALFAACAGVTDAERGRRQCAGARPP